MVLDMKIIGFTTVLITLCLINALPAFAQDGVIDVVYLKNGSVIRGTIINVELNKTVSIRTKDESIFVFEMSEVDRIVKEDASISMSTRPDEPNNSNLSRDNQANSSNTGRNLEARGVLTKPGATGVKSFIFPLWGHLPLKNQPNTIRGSLYSGLSVAAIYFAIDGGYYAYCGTGCWRKTFGGPEMWFVVLGIHTVAAIDGYLSAEKLNNALRSRNIQLGVAPGPSARGIQVNLTYSF